MAADRKIAAWMPGCAGTGSSATGPQVRAMANNDAPAPHGEPQRRADEPGNPRGQDEVPVNPNGLWRPTWPCRSVTGTWPIDQTMIIPLAVTGR